MSSDNLTHNQNINSRPLALFTDAGQLKSWLRAHGVDTTGWGQQAAKTVADLWQEVQQGECQLILDETTHRPLRTVQVVEVHIIWEDKLLHEQSQQFADGRIRTRNRPPSEKLHPGETPLAAARRCIQEELAVAVTAITVPLQTPAKRVVCDESGSYPSLLSEYTFYTVHARVVGLPEHDFTTPNAAHSDGDPIVAHHWSWVPCVA